MALLSKFQDEQVVLLSGWGLDAPKTKAVVSGLASVGVGASSTLIVTDGLDSNVYRSARNVPNVQVLPASDLNAYSLLRHRNLVVTTGAMDSLLGRGAAVPA
jgi:large subunit ribosomal protein L4